MQYISTGVSMDCFHYYVALRLLTCGTSVIYNVIEGSKSMLLGARYSSCQLDNCHLKL